MNSPLPPKVKAGQVMATGYATPKEDKIPQTLRVPPKRVLPIVFLPGIMGSNLRMSRERQRQLNRKNNIAWRPDRITEALGLISADPAMRQLQLDPLTTEVDSYDEGEAPTGNNSETAQERQANGRVRVKIPSGDSLLLVDDPPTQHSARSKEEKALERGWGEIYFSSYRHILETCEQDLNGPIAAGGLTRVVDVDPTQWGATESPKLTPLTDEDLKKAVKGCLFPVHAMGYNWLHPADSSATLLAKRIQNLIDKYSAQGLQCKKVILVTHSMGGLVGRALVHPEMGNMGEKILGTVHGVLPAVGAPAAYKRMRCGFEEGPFGLSPAPKILGNFGSEVTAVLGNSIGGLQLLPSCEYGNGWLKVMANGVVLESFPKAGDPYREIYQLKDRWFGLLRDEWLNPARSDVSSFKMSCQRLERAKAFHLAIAATYHPQSFAHYGADARRHSWESITWNFDSTRVPAHWEKLVIRSDSQQGKLILEDPEAVPGVHQSVKVFLGKSSGPGDETVPAKSADHQFVNGKFKGIFRQTGYEHQASYSDTKAVLSTLFSIVKIALTMDWNEP
ncbi:esterase/lipase family protein [Pseudoduganella sp. OTU4001]|uniref:esterase/lipase family protein n=1 Tax=Pseudoduganella sp. OTU4001 TaxID=3043854 RepID=UPI00313E4991